MERSDTFFRDAIIGLTAFFLGVFLPLPTLFIVHFVGQSEFFEEVIKSLVVILLISDLSTNGRRFFWSLAFGGLFGLSEAMLYLAQNFSSGLIEDFWVRLVTTVPMHSLTTVLVIIPIILFRRRVWGIAGFLLALSFHLLFNAYVAGSV
jgi:hypothetical protein